MEIGESRMSGKPIFKVIDGGAISPSRWLSPPSTILARSPLDPEQVIGLRFSTKDIEKLSVANRKQPLFDAWSMIHGRLPPLPNISKVSAELELKPLYSIRDAHACFRGLKRPYGSDDNGFDVFAYVLKPAWFLRFRPSMVCVGSLERVPEDLVFVVYAILDWPLEGRRSDCRLPTAGVVTKWEFVEGDPLAPDLPIDFAARYRKRQW